MKKVRVRVISIIALTGAILFAGVSLFAGAYIRSSLSPKGHVERMATRSARTFTVLRRQGIRYVLPITSDRQKLPILWVATPRGIVWMMPHEPNKQQHIWTPRQTYVGRFWRIYLVRTPEKMPTHQVNLLTASVAQAQFPLVIRNPYVGLPGYQQLTDLQRPDPTSLSLSA